MRLAGGQHVVVRLVLLEHPPGALHVVEREAPVALRLEVAESPLVLLTAQDAADGDRDLACDEALRAPRRLVVEQDPVDRIHPVRLAVIARYPVGEELPDGVWA